ncbi:MAG: hypothetical protein AAGH15_26230 [Myxococcota bacterium]
MRIATLSLLALLACGSPGAVSRTVRVDDLACASGGDAVPWESAPWPPASEAEGCGWLDFGARVTLEIEHGLGRTPRDVGLTISFFPDGASSAPSAGDTARILSVTETAVVIENGTNEDFFLKVVLF